MLFTEYAPFPTDRLPRRWMMVFLALWAATTVIHTLWVAPYVVALGPTAQRILPHTGLLSPLNTVLPSFSFALPLAIWSLSPLPARVLFRPTRARVLGALGLWFLFPMAFAGPLPISAGWTFLITPRLLTGPVLLAFCYIIACLLSSGLPHRGLRSGAYLLIYIGALATCVAAGTAFWRFTV
ncbi:MAG: hypothetical protein GYB25_14960 [Rhodobacteraceae bacterium]|nr:hypothetical protein [Paracoccaceae bacterium]